MKILAALFLAFICFCSSGGGGGGACTTNGSDGFASAPAGAAQFPSLLSSYAARPPWCVAGVDYAVGFIPNATVSGNTITETNVANIPVNADQKSFYPQHGGSLPSGITQGTAYYVCGVSGSSTTYSYTLSTASNCSSTVTLGALATSFVALKVPSATTNVPAGTSGWNGASCATTGTTFTICVSASNITLDHWDFSAGGGWLIATTATTISGTTITSNYWVMGTNLQGFLQDLSGGDTSNLTFNNNVIDGNAVSIYTTAASTVASGASSITVASAAGLSARMTVCDLTSTGAITCPGTLVSSIVGTTINLSAATAGTITSGDSIAFISVPYTGPSGGHESLYQVPQISWFDKGTMTAEYNWIRNTYSEHWQESLTNGNAQTGNITFKFNLFENTGYGGAVTGAHGDVLQVYCGTAGGTGANCSFQALDLEYNTVIQNNATAQAGTTTFSMLISGTYGGTATVGSVLNNIGIYSVASGDTSTYGLAAINPTWFTTSVNVENNYVDPTSACSGTNCGSLYWSEVNSAAGGGNGGHAPTCTATGNVNLVTGGALPKPNGGYC